MTHLAGTSVLLAAIYLLDNEETARWARVCIKWCEQHGYHLVSVVMDATPDGAKWRDIVRMMADGDVDVCVVPRWDQMPRDRVPRVEVIAEDEAGPSVMPRQRRPHRRT